MKLRMYWHTFTPSVRYCKFVWRGFVIVRAVVDMIHSTVRKYIHTDRHAHTPTHMHIQIHTHTHTKHTHTITHIQIHTHTHTHIHTRTNTHIQIHTHAYRHTQSIHTHNHTHTCTHTHILIYQCRWRLQVLPHNPVIYRTSRGSRCNLNEKWRTQGPTRQKYVR